MNDVMTLIYINFLIMREKKLKIEKIQSTLWPLLRDNIGASEQFQVFIDEYARRPNDLIVWPIFKFFIIWA